MPRLLGHNFLKSNWKEGDPLRAVANARQANRGANVLKYVQGMGISIDKPVDAEGKNWVIRNDGSSDIELPPTWQADGQGVARDQFKVYKALEDVRFTVTHSSMYGEPASNLGDITWPVDGLGDIIPGSESIPYTLDPGADVEIWAEYYEPVPPAIEGVLKLVVLEAGGTPSGDENALIATIKVGANFAATLLQVQVPQFAVTMMPRPLVGFRVSGGVWQEFIGDATVVHEPVTVAGGVEWGLGDYSHHDAFSRAFKAGGVLWAVLDKTSVTPEFYFKIEDPAPGPDTSDPDEWWLKIATVEFEREDPDDDDSELLDVLIQQHHMGGIHHGASASAKAIATLTGGSATTTGGVAVEGFALGLETNDAVLDVDAANNKITVKKSGNYQVTFGGQFFSEEGSPGEHGCYINLEVNGSAVTPLAGHTMLPGDWAGLPESAVPNLLTGSSQTLLLALEEDDVLTLEAIIINSGEAQPIHLQVLEL
jgi:hypothetical protein